MRTRRELPSLLLRRRQGLPRRRPVRRAPPAPPSPKGCIPGPPSDSGHPRRSRAPPPTLLSCTRRRPVRSPYGACPCSRRPQKSSTVLSRRWSKSRSRCLSGSTLSLRALLRPYKLARGPPRSGETRTLPRPSSISASSRPCSGRGAADGHSIACASCFEPVQVLRQSLVKFDLGPPAQESKRLRIGADGPREVALVAVDEV